MVDAVVEKSNVKGSPVAKKQRISYHVVESQDVNDINNAHPHDILIYQNLKEMMQEVL